MERSIEQWITYEAWNEKDMVKATALSLVIGHIIYQMILFPGLQKMEREHPSSAFAFERMYTKCSDNQILLRFLDACLTTSNYSPSLIEGVLLLINSPELNTS